MKEEFELIAKTFQGLEEVLAKELTELGASNIEVGRRMVAFTGDKEMMYRANFCLRTAIRILKPIKHLRRRMPMKFTKLSRPLRGKTSWIKIKVLP